MAPLLILVGFMGSGKTSVGEQVARRLGWSFLDLDEEIVRETGKPIPAIFREQGEATFRALESQILTRLLGEESARQPKAETGLVLALGGGTLESGQVRTALRHRGPVVLLDVEAEEAWQRVAGSDRPLAQDRARFGELFAARRQRYLEAADWVIPSRVRGVEELATEIEELVSQLGASWEDSWGRRLENTGRSSLIVGGKGAMAYLSSRTRLLAEEGIRIFAVTDENVEEAWGEDLMSLLAIADPQDGPRRLLVLPPGEATKSVRSLEHCWEWLAAAGCRRDDVLLAFGGGVVGDLAGFAAATYHRGVKLWQVPTSLLAQVDSSVGGKTAVNLAAGKNLVGAFYQPDLVVIDPVFLSTLPEAEFRNGLGEVVKYGLLAGPALFAELEESAERLHLRDERLLGWVVKRCVQFKAEVVEQDERDEGLRAVLNLGHTTAHALESAAGYGNVAHGIAVGLGLLVALRVSERRLGLDPEVRRRTLALLEKLGLPVRLSLPPIDLLVKAARRDKKVMARTAGFVGLKGLGLALTSLDVSEQDLAEALEEMAA